MSSSLYSMIIIGLIAVLTFGARFFPFAIFSRGGETPKIALYLGNVLPPAVMMVLIVYCLRSVNLESAGKSLPELLSVASVAILYKITKNNLIAMVVGTILYMVLIQRVFV